MTYLYIIAFSIVFAMHSGFPQKFNLLNRKPFICESCISFWFSLIYTGSQGENFFNSFGLACCIFMVTKIISKLLLRFIGV